MVFSPGAGKTFEQELPLEQVVTAHRLGAGCFGGSFQLGLQLEFLGAKPTIDRVSAASCHAQRPSGGNRLCPQQEPTVWCTVRPRREPLEGQRQGDVAQARPRRSLG